MKARLKRWMTKTAPGRAVWRAAHGVKFELLNLPDGLKCLYAGRWRPAKHILMKTSGTRKRQNWGDDINFFFFEAATGKRVLRCPDSWFFRRTGLENHLCIGSTLTFYRLDGTVVWGAGLINDRQGHDLLSRPRSIRAVRGPLTRNWLLAHGVDCPAVYGDPALLLPRFYTPAPRPRTRFGIVPHVSDWEQAGDVLRRMESWADTKLVAMRDYGDWCRVIDDIASCDLVLSSSLHGLIVAEAYGIPALWVEFDTPIPGWEFKFNDFYASIGKAGLAPFRVTEATRSEELWARRASWVPARLDLEPLLAACPFALRPFG